MCFWDLEPLTPLTDEFRRARKEHRCCDCARIIKKGERYEYVAGIADYDFNTWKTCMGCVNLREAIAKIELKHGCPQHAATPGYGMAREAAYDYPELRQLMVIR